MSETARDAFLECSQTNKSEKCKARTLFYLNGTSFMLAMAAYFGLMDLQSSMNIEEGLGTTSLFLMYGIASFSALLITPFVTDYLGARKTLLLGYSALFLYSVANFFPGWWTLLPASALQGMCDSWIWVGNSKVVVHLGTKYCELKYETTNSLTAQGTVAKYIGYNGAFINVGEILGNAISHFILLSFKHRPHSPATTNISFVNHTIAPEVEDWSNCGAKDCQKLYIYSNSSNGLAQYLPNKIGINIVIGIYCTLEIIALVIAFIYIPQVPRKIFKKEHTKKYMDSKCPLLLKLYMREIGKTFTFLICRQQILMTIVEIYYGLFLAFKMSEFTRAYVSCTLGIEMIGLVAIFYALGGIAMSWVCARIVPKFGRVSTITVVMIVHMSIFLFELLWRPNIDTIWMIYAIGFISGLADLGMDCLMESSISAYFAKSLAIGFSAKAWADGIGLGIGFAWSAPLCVEYKLYVLLVFAFVAYVSWMFSEYRHYKKCKQTEKTFPLTNGLS